MTKRIIEWQVEDGYVGKSRPHQFTVNTDGYDWCNTLDDVEVALYDDIQKEFENKITWHSVTDIPALAKEIWEELQADDGA